MRGRRSDVGKTETTKNAKGKIVGMGKKEGLKGSVERTCFGWSNIEKKCGSA